MTSASRSTRIVLIALLAALGCAHPAAAQTPRVVNGRIEAASGGALDATFKSIVASSSDAAWIGYSVPLVAGQRLCCDGDTWISGDVVMTNGRLAGCTLEPSQTSERASSNGIVMNNPVRLEGPESFDVLFRVENRAVERIRIFSSDCEIDAGGRTMHWLGSVDPGASVALLSGFVAKTQQRGDRLTDSAIAAIAMHRADAADAALEQLASTSSPEFVRGKATFWMGIARGHRGFEDVTRIARTDPSASVRKQAMFALSRSGDEQAIPELIRFARDDASPAVRGEAIFWLAQKAGQKAQAQITSSIDNDPDTDVKKRAVFALSQLPKDQGVPLLIQVAKTNKNPAVRKQAMFWLGQTKDPRALDFFAEVLGK
ncbi:MAG: HEAT repeat domain-containing protein [Vicinamibacterales bacterium]